MYLDAVPFLSALGLGDAFSSPLGYLGLSQQPAILHEVVALYDGNQFLNKPPAGFEQVSLSWVRDNLAVIPGEWEAGDISQYLHRFSYVETNEFQRHHSMISSQTTRPFKTH